MTTARSFEQWWVEHAGVHPAATDPMFMTAQYAWNSGVRGQFHALEALKPRVTSDGYLLMCEAYDAGRKAAKSIPLACAG